MAKVWKLPPRVKLFEALGAIADGRIGTAGEEGKETLALRDSNAPLPPFSTELSYLVTSSNGTKQYSVRMSIKCLGGPYRIACNDNGSLHQGYLGYPALAVLICWRLLVSPKLSDATLSAAVDALRGIPWKAIAVEHKNNWDVVVDKALERVTAKDPALTAQVNSVVDALHEELKTCCLPKCVRFGSKRGRD